MTKKLKNAIYAQSGGVTSVINATASGLIMSSNKANFGKIYAGLNGIIGVLEENLVDTSQFTEETLVALKQTPGGFFGSCRYKLDDIEKNSKVYQRLFEVFKAYDIGYFFYNGGNDSADTCLKIGEAAKKYNYDLKAIHLPKTVDNDLPITDFSPGFGSVAKYIGVSTRETSLDIKSMYLTSTKVFILEVMGRHAGWIAASASLAQTDNSKAPQLILLPEVTFDRKNFVEEVKKTVETQGFAVVVASEGIKDASGNFVSQSQVKDAFGHSQLGGVAPKLASIISEDTGYKNHWAVADYMQRSARHLASKVDLQAAFAVGEAGIKFALEGKNLIMPALIRTKKDATFAWELKAAPLEQIANVERKLPADFISANGFGITKKGKDYLHPLIDGEAYPSYKAGMPDYLDIVPNRVEKKLATYKV